MYMFREKQKKKENDQRELENILILYDEKWEVQAPNCFQSSHWGHGIPCVSRQQESMEDVTFTFCLVQFKYIEHLQYALWPLS